MKKSQNLLVLKVLFGIVHLLIFGFVLYMCVSSPANFIKTIPLLGLVVADALFMQYVIKKDEEVALTELEQVPSKISK